MALWCSPADVIGQPGCADFAGDPGSLLPLIEAASDALFARSGRQFGTRTVTVRPCARHYQDAGLRPPGWHETWGTVGSSHQGWWRGSRRSSARLHPDGPIHLQLGIGAIIDVVEVKVDGAVLVAGVDYRIDEGTWLVRLPDGDKVRTWPATQRLELADTEEGTWSVTALVGTPVPVLGTLAAAELSCELNRLGSDDCALSPRVTAVNNQGVQLQFIGLSEALQAGQTGLPLVDLFITTYNPKRIQARARVLFPVPSGVRRTDTDGPS